MNFETMICIVLLSVSCIFCSIVNAQQTEKIADLQKQVRCLEHGHVWVGGELCQDEKLYNN